MDTYKVTQLKIMFKHETDPKTGGYGAHLSHWQGEAKPINRDAGALRLLIDYYSTPDE